VYQTKVYDHSDKKGNSSEKKRHGDELKHYPQQTRTELTRRERGRGKRRTLGTKKSYQTKENKWMPEGDQAKIPNRVGTNGGNKAPRKRPKLTPHLLPKQKNTITKEAGVIRKRETPSPQKQFNKKKTEITQQGGNENPQPESKFTRGKTSV